MNFSTCKDARKARAISSGQTIFDGHTLGVATFCHSQSSFEILAHEWIDETRLAVVTNIRAQNAPQPSDTKSQNVPHPQIRATFQRMADIPELKIIISSATFLGEIAWVNPTDFNAITKQDFTFYHECGYTSAVIRTARVLIQNFEGITSLCNPGKFWQQHTTKITSQQLLHTLSEQQLQDIYIDIACKRLPGKIYPIDGTLCTANARSIYGVELNESGMTILNFHEKGAELVFAQYTPQKQLA